VCAPGKQATADTKGNCCWPGQLWSLAESTCVGPASACPAGYEVAQDGCQRLPWYCFKVHWNDPPWDMTRCGGGFPKCQRLWDLFHPAPSNGGSYACTVQAKAWCSHNKNNGDICFASEADCNSDRETNSPRDSHDAPCTIREPFDDIFYFNGHPL
jgi:hypothetical protein